MHFVLFLSQGTMIIGGQKYITAAYYTQVMGLPPVVRWFDLVGISTDSSNLAIVYIGCNPPPDTNYITTTYEEDFQNQLREDDPSGWIDCNFVDLSSKPNYKFAVSMPALIGLPENPFNTSVTISGTEVILNNDHGWMIANKRNYTIIPISTVNCDDCGENCDTCYQSPWYEIHFIHYSDATPPITGFGIFYIYPYNQTFVQLNYTINFPTLEQLAITYQATWSGDPFTTELGGHSRYSPTIRKHKIKQTQQLSAA